MIVEKAGFDFVYVGGYDVALMQNAIRISSSSRTPMPLRRGLDEAIRRGKALEEKYLPPDEVKKKYDGAAEL